MWSPLYYVVGIENTKSESFDYVDRFIECRNAGLASLIKLDSTDPENQMAQIGNHLKSTIQENFSYKTCSLTKEVTKIKHFASERVFICMEQ